MRKLILILILLLPALFVSEDALGQYRRKSRAKAKRNKAISSYKGGRISTVSRFSRYHSVGANVNALNYFGDIAPLAKAASTDISFTRPGLGVTWTYRLDKYFNVRAAFNWGRLRADDFDSADPTLDASLPRYTRNLSFRNDIKELSVVFEMDLLPNKGGPGSRMPLAPYLFAGGAIFHHEPKGLAPANDRNGNPLPEAGQWVSLRELGTEGQHSEHYPDVKPYSSFQYAIPFGAGLRMRLPGPFDAAFEIGYRMLFFDHIDDLSGNYVDPGAFGTNELARAMADRSLEPVSSAGETRIVDEIVERYGIGSRVSAIDGQPYTLIPGWGYEGDKRGSPANNDQYIITQVRLMYIIGKVRRSAKFR